MKKDKREYFLSDELEWLEPKPPAGSQVLLVDVKMHKTDKVDECYMWTYLGAKEWHYKRGA